MDGWMDEWMVGWMDGWMEEWMDKSDGRFEWTDILKEQTRKDSEIVRQTE